MNDREASLPRRTPRRECWRAIEEWWAMQGSNLAPLPCEYTAPVVLISLLLVLRATTVFAVCFAVFCATGYVLQAAQIALAFSIWLRFMFCSQVIYGR